MKGEIFMTNWVQVGLLVIAVFSLLRASDALVEMLRTIRRIESRLTLLMPLESEEKLLQEKWLIKAHIRDRAVHPDIWISEIIKEQGDLRGKEWREVRELQRYRERQYRD